MNLKPIYIEATDIPDAWFQCIYNLFDYGRKYVVQQGSFVGQTRLEFDAVTVKIKHPYNEPWDTMLPQIPTHFNIPNPVENGYIEQYMPYLMSGEREKKESYSYGSRLNKVLLWEYIKDLFSKNISTSGRKEVYYEEDSFWEEKNIVYRDDREPGDCELPYVFLNQVELIIWNFKNKGYNSNQAILQVAQPSDLIIKDPPCLRSIHVKIIDNKLVFYPYFRSNDLWGGFPANLAGIAVLQKYMADEIGVPVGEMIYFSSGLHVYGYVEEIAKLRCNK